MKHGFSAWITSAPSFPRKRHLALSHRQSTCDPTLTNAPFYTWDILIWSRGSLRYWSCRLAATRQRFLRFQRHAPAVCALSTPAVLMLTPTCFQIRWNNTSFPESVARPYFLAASAHDGVRFQLQWCGSLPRTVLVTYWNLADLWSFTFYKQYAKLDITGSPWKPVAGTIRCSSSRQLGADVGMATFARLPSLHVYGNVREKIHHLWRCSALNLRQVHGGSTPLLLSQGFQFRYAWGPHTR